MIAGQMQKVIDELAELGAQLNDLGAALDIIGKEYPEWPHGGFVEDVVEWLNRYDEWNDRHAAVSKQYEALRKKRSEMIVPLVGLGIPLSMPLRSTTGWIITLGTASMYAVEVLDDHDN